MTSGKPTIIFSQKADTIEPYLLIPIDRIQPKLTAFNEGKIKPIGKLKGRGSQQFRSVRHFTEASAKKLDNLIRRTLKEWE
jgi:hypothetical protein